MGRASCVSKATKSPSPIFLLSLQHFPINTRYGRPPLRNIVTLATKQQNPR